MNSKKILIVEDDKFLLKLYSEKLSREGFKIATATTGKEAINQISSSPPDLIILDIILPGKDGFEVLSEIKLNPKTKKIPVIILTILGEDKDIKMGKELGADDYIIKTEFSVNELPGVVKKYLIKAGQN